MCHRLASPADVEPGKLTPGLVIIGQFRNLFQPTATAQMLAVGATRQNLPVCLSHEHALHY